MGFRNWIENEMSREFASRDIILDYLKQRLNFTDDEAILQLNTKKIDAEVINDLLTRGIIKNSELISQRIKDGITIEDLIQLISDPTQG